MAFAFGKLLRHDAKSPLTNVFTSCIGKRATASLNSVETPRIARKLFEERKGKTPSSPPLCAASSTEITV